MRRQVPLPVELLPYHIASSAARRTTRSWPAYIPLGFVALCGITLLSRHNNLTSVEIQSQDDFSLTWRNGTAAFAAQTPSSSDDMDAAFKLGPTDPLAYRHSLESSIFSAYPPALRPEFSAALERSFPGSRDSIGPLDSPRARTAMAGHQNVWQTDKGRTKDKGAWSRVNKDWKWNLLDDVEAEDWVKQTFGSSRLKGVWDVLPTMILVSAVLTH